MSSVFSAALIVLLSLFGHTIVIRLAEGRAIDPRCQAMRIPWCLGLYDSVIFPNSVGHHAQEEAYYSMHRFWPLVKSECSPQLLHYLCRLHAPQCPYSLLELDPRDPLNQQHHAPSSYHPEYQLPPCEDACLTVRRDCHWVLLEHEIHWPSELECHNLRNKSCVATPQFQSPDPWARHNVPQHHVTTAPAISTTQEVITEPAPVETTTVEVPNPEPVVSDVEEATTPVIVEVITESTTIPEVVELSTPGEMETTPISDDDDDMSPEESTTAAPAEPITPEGSLLGINPVIQEETTTSMAEGPADEEHGEDATTTGAPELQEGDAENRAAASLPVEGHSASEDGGEVIEPAAGPAEEKSAEDSDGKSSSSEEAKEEESALRSGFNTANNAGYSWSNKSDQQRMMIIYLTLVSVIYRYIAA